MACALKRPHAQFKLRSLLAAMTWAALVIAICVGHQQAASRQREWIEHLKTTGALPATTVGGPTVGPAPTAAASPPPLGQPISR